ncbi:HlyD family efflux transporter periplasmic adaptor subunit [Polaromonas sp.]|uniref:efflux RND transporter periplasmic adaptor subunit n=1 Tax=Polaromonas sp. TaxID=1869339 RepID=UPI0017E7D97E|nr:HlyD family efflux transporter periplasmic adaptor subunit [Polaromonas sp.]NMM05380.1 HlyD family efflux transporter periplasmic adaptor subunit [Polaromonas sp.]
MKKRFLTSAVCAALCASLLALTAPVWAAGDHEGGHGPAGADPAATGSGPKRLPDGSVFLPKPAQRQMGVRTLVGEVKQLPRSTELSGKVVMDPNAGGKVQSLVAGRLQAGPRGLPSVGQTVRKGEVLAYVLPAAAAIERSNQSAQLAELGASRSLANKRLARLQELADTVPRKEIEAAESEVASLGARAAAVGAGLSARDALVAPVSGVIASANAVAGQVVDARELLFEVIDPSRLRIEALAFDAALAADVGGAFLAVGGQKVPLIFVGASRSLRDQALPLAFRAEGQSLSQLAVGQPVAVVVQSRSQVSGVPVPAGSLTKNPANQTVVWVKTAPERFEARVVTVEPLDGATMAVTSGLKAGDRVATQGATLINQVR